MTPGKGRLSYHYRKRYLATCRYPAKTLLPNLSFCDVHSLIFRWHTLIFLVDIVHFLKLDICRHDSESREIFKKEKWNLRGGIEIVLVRKSTYKLLV